MAERDTTSEKVRKVLAGATDYLPLNAISMAVFGRAGSRERSAVSVILHRMGDEVERRPSGYRKKR